MSNTRQIVRRFRRQIPAFSCQEGCHDCCGPVMASSEEMSGLPPVSAEVREAALAEWRCPYLGEAGCRVYAERPLVCRLFGTTPRLPCPNGRRPTLMVDTRIDQQIERFFKEVRHVLL